MSRPYYVGYSSETRIFEQYIDYVRELFGENHELLAINMDLYNKTDIEDRVIPLDRVKFIAENFGLILSAAIMNYHDTVEVMNDAIGTEVGFEDMSVEERTAARAKLLTLSDSNVLSIVAGITSFSPVVTTALLESADESMLRTGMCEALDAARVKIVNELRDEDRMALGVIFNSPAYLLRAACRNDKFYESMVTIINDLEKEFDIQSFEYYKALLPFEKE